MLDSTLDSTGRPAILSRPVLNPGFTVLCHCVKPREPFLLSFYAFIKKSRPKNLYYRFILAKTEMYKPTIANDLAINAELDT